MKLTPRARKPVVIPYPLELTTARLCLCSPALHHARDIYEGARESYPEARRWLSWAKSRPDLREFERLNRDSMAKFIAGPDFHFRVFLREGHCFVGTAGVISVDPAVPSYEIGYWCRTRMSGHGYTSEAVAALVDFARGRLQARRVQIRIDERNRKSRRIPERLGFGCEGTLRNVARDHHGRLVHMRVYARTF
jgi:RimJ/RimL family protein N-acetyltransferase